MSAKDQHQEGSAARASAHSPMYLAARGSGASRKARWWEPNAFYMRRLSSWEAGKMESALNEPGRVYSTARFI